MKALETKLRELDTRHITCLDGDVIRQHISKGLGFSKEDRSTNVRRIGYIASEIVKHNGIVLAANIAPYSDDRNWNKETIGNNYIECFVNTSLDVCEERDCKGLYKLARKGVIANFTGISDPFEIPENPDISLELDSIENQVNNILNCLKQKGLLN